MGCYSYVNIAVSVIYAQPTYRNIIFDYGTGAIVSDITYIFTGLTSNSFLIISTLLFHESLEVIRKSY